MSEFENEPTVEQPVEQAAEPTWVPSQEEWGQLQQAVNYLAQLEQQRAQVYQPPQESYQDWDPYDPNQIDQRLEQRLAPVYQFIEQQTQREGTERMYDVFEDLAAKEGDFDRETAILRAERYYPQMEQRYGKTPKAAEMALEQAVKDQRAYEQKMYEDAVNRYTNQIATLAGAPAEPGTTYTQGVQVRAMGDYRQGGSVTDRFFGGNNGG